MNLLLLDIEVFQNYFLCGFLSDCGYERLSSFDSVSRAKLSGILSKLVGERFVTGHNIAAYDLPVIDYILKDKRDFVPTEEIKSFSDGIIEGGAASRFTPSRWPRVIDSLKIVGGTKSLKLLSTAINSPQVPHWKKDFGSLLPEDEAELIRYNELDILATRELLSLNPIQEKIKTRAFFAAQLGHSVYARSEPSTAVDFLLKAAKITPPAPELSLFRLGDILSEYKFEQACFSRAYEKFRSFHVTDGSEKLSFSGKDYQFAGLAFQFGKGGVHAFNSAKLVVDEKANGPTEILDIDFTSFYPNLILKHGIFEGALATTYRDVLEERISAKKEGNSQKANALKLVLNSVFGQLKLTYLKRDGTRDYGKLYNLRGFFKTTVEGQLTAAKLCENLAPFGEILLVNTDGLVVKTANGTGIRQAVREFCDTEALPLEVTELDRFYAKGVNDLVSRTTGGKVKAKGCFSNKELTLPDSPEICVRAAVSHILDGADIAPAVRGGEVTDYLIKKQSSSGFFREGISLGFVIRGVAVKTECPNIYHVDKDGTRVSAVKDANIELLPNLKDGPRGALDFDWYERKVANLVFAPPKETVVYGTYFPNLTEPKKAKRVKIDTVLNEIRGTRHAKKIATLRGAVGSARADIKKTLPTYLPQGEFEYRGKDGVRKWGDYIAVDLDRTDEGEEISSVEKVKRELFDNLSCVKAAFLSPSGSLKLILKVKRLLNAETYLKAKKKAFSLISGCVANLGVLDIEKETDLAKGFFLSHDPGILVREEPESMDYPRCEKTTAKQGNGTAFSYNYTKNTAKRLETQLSEATQKGERYETRSKVANIAGGGFAVGKLTEEECENLKKVAISESDNPESAEKEWDSSFRHGAKRPPAEPTSQTPLCEPEDRSYTLENFDMDATHFASRGILPTGLSKIDEILKIRAGDFLVIAAQSSHGKTALMVQLVSSFLSAGGVCDFTTYESHRHYIAQRLLKHISRGDYQKYCESKSLYLGGRMDIDQISAHLEKLREIHPDRQRVLFLDYFQIIDTLSNKDGWQLIKEMAGKLEKAAIETGTLIVTGSQVNADGDTREGRDIYNSATHVLQIFNHSHTKLKRTTAKRGAQDTRFKEAEGGKAIITINLEKSKHFPTESWRQQFWFDGAFFTERTVEEPLLPETEKQKSPLQY